MRLWSLLYIPIAAAAVIEATDKDIDSLLANGVPTILDIYATWCGHCKTFSPVFDELAALYEDAKDKIQFIKIDGDTHRKTASKFNLKYFPTIKFVDGESVEDVEGRDIDSLKELIKTKTGVGSSSAAKAREAPSAVLELDDLTFEDGVDGKHALVAFTTTWCGYCKKLHPEWEKLAQVYARDQDIEIVSVDCTDGGADALMSTFEVKSYPTIIYFPKDGSVPRPYVGGREIKDFADFFAREGASFRGIDGSLGDSAGIIEPLAFKASALIGAATDKFDEFEQAIADYVSETASPYAEYYAKFAKKVAAGGQEYVDKEIARLTSLLQSNAAADKLDSIKVRFNILKSFLPGADTHKSPEKKAEDEIKNAAADVEDAAQKAAEAIKEEL